MVDEAVKMSVMWFYSLVVYSRINVRCNLSPGQATEYQDG
jgi:hypothetical protein